MDTLGLSKNIKTSISVVGLDANAQQVFAKHFQNTITYAGADKIVAAITGSDVASITHLYAYFSARGNPGISANLPSGNLKEADRAAFVVGANNGNPGSAFGAIWVPVSPNVIVESATESYEGNRITYSFNIPAAVAVDDSSKIGEFIADSSEIRAIGLAVANSYADRSKDTIFSIIDIPEAADVLNRQLGESFVIPSGGQVVVDYTITFYA